MKIELIPRNVLLAVRQNLGAEDENDTSYDNQIENMKPIDLVGKYSAWHLGDAGWGRDFVGIYIALNDALHVEGEKDA